MRKKTVVHILATLGVAAAVFVSSAPDPVVVQVMNIQHLATPIRAQLRSPIAAVELAGPVEHAVRERATAARAAVACPAARRKRRLGRARLGVGRGMGFLRSMMRT